MYNNNHRQRGFSMKKNAFVTGADRGLGYSLTEVLLENDYRVFAGRYMKDWPWLDRLKEKHGDDLYLVDLDISDTASVKRAAESIKIETDSLDLLINNAAIVGPEENNLAIFEDVDIDKILRVYNVNTLGALRVTHALIDLVLNSRDKLIVNISSEAGSIARCWRTGEYGYCMSKAALNMQSAILHNSIREKGGQVLVVHPGWMQTYMQGVRNDKADFPPEKSASDIYKLIQRKDEFKGDKPVFIDHLGNLWPW